jgi:hypothetical protein
MASPTPCGEENQSIGFTCGIKRPQLLRRGLKLTLPEALRCAPAAVVPATFI